MVQRGVEPTGVFIIPAQVVAPHCLSGKRCRFEDEITASKVVPGVGGRWREEKEEWSEGGG